jgi:hypothetical protein
MHRSVLERREILCKTTRSPGKIDFQNAIDEAMAASKDLSSRARKQNWPRLV